METLLVGIIVDTFLEASYMFGYRQKANAVGHTNPKLMDNAKEAFAFISGTGLDIMIKEYGIDLNPEELRFQFYQKFGIPNAE